jgi:hypothetical protein
MYQRFRGNCFSFSVQNWNTNDIQLTKEILSSQNQLLGSLQIGPDNKIYVSKVNSLYLGCIANPIGSGIGCQYNPTAAYLNGRQCEAGLPQLNIAPVEFYFSVPDVCVGDTSEICFSSGAYPMDSIKFYYSENPILDVQHRRIISIFFQERALIP